MASPPAERGRILLVDVAGGRSVPLHASAPVLSSAGAPWNDIVKLEEHHVPAGETPERRCGDHLLIASLRLRDRVGWRAAGEAIPCRDIRPPLGDIHILARGVPFSACWPQATRLLLLALDPGFVARQTGRAEQIGLASAWHVRDPAIRHMMLALRAELQTGCPSGRLYGEALATALAVHLLHHRTARPPGVGDHRGTLPPACLRRVLDHIEAHLGEDTRLHRLAALAQLSPRHFAALFKQSTGLSPHRYVLQRRIERAKELLRDRRRSVAEVGYALGFPSQAHFTTMFRKLIGTTPAAYRKQS